MKAIKHNNMPTPMYDIGDLLTINQQGQLVWAIIGYTCVTSFLCGKATVSVTYNLSSVNTVEFKVVDESKVFLVCTAPYANEYLQMLDNKGLPPKYSSNNSYNETVKVKEVPTMLKQQLTKKEKLELVDDLLDRYNTTLRFIEIDGETSELNQEQIDNILEELNKIEF